MLRIGRFSRASSACALAVAGLLLVACTSGSTGRPAGPDQAAAIPTSAVATTGPPSASSPPTTAPSPHPVATSSSRTSSSPTSSSRTSSSPTSSLPTGPSTTTGATSSAPTVRPARVIEVLPTSEKVVALTFDGGADNRGAAQILAILRREGAPASFFVTGRFAAAYPALVSDLAGVGPVGNHSWDHPHLPQLGDPAVLAQLDTTRSKILAVTGRDPIPFFRFPFGESDSRTRTLVASRGYLAIGWTVDSLGWQGTSGGQSASKVADRVVAAARPGQIVLMHLGAHPSDHSTLDADALGPVISRLRAQGYRFVTLDALR